MKAKTKLFAMLLFAAFAFVSCDDDDDVRVSQDMFDALFDKYPNAVDVDWDKRGVYYVADFWNDRHDMNAWFDGRNTWIMSDTEILWSEVPAEVQSAFGNSGYASWRQEGVDYLQYADGSQQYVLELENGNRKVQLYYLPDGQFYKEKDVSHRDNIIWP